MMRLVASSKLVWAKPKVPEPDAVSVNVERGVTELQFRVGQVLAS
mgnify:CR=1 FL=1